MRNSSSIGWRSTRRSLMRCRAAPLCAVAYCRRADPARHSDDRCRSRWRCRNSGTTTAPPWSAPMPRPKPRRLHADGALFIGRIKSFITEEKVIIPYREWSDGIGTEERLRSSSDDRLVGAERSTPIPPALATTATEAIRLPPGQNAPQRPPRGLYTEQFSGTAVHRAARREPALLALSHPALGDAPAVSPDRQWPRSQRAVRRGDAAAQPAQMEPAAVPGRAGRFHRRARHDRRQWRRERALRRRDPHLPRDQADAAPRLLRRRRRAVDRAADWAGCGSPPNSASSRRDPARSP